MKKVKQVLKDYGFIFLAIAVGIAIVIVPLYYHKISDANQRHVELSAETFCQQHNYDAALSLVSEYRFDNEEMNDLYYEIQEEKEDYDNYNHALSSMEDEMWVYAIYYFAQCIDYQDSKDKIDLCLNAAILADYTEYELEFMQREVKEELGW